jgi:hypothetical protein
MKVRTKTNLTAVKNRQPMLIVQENRWMNQVFVIASVFTFLMGVNTWAANVTWTGTDGNWTNVASWGALGRVPDGTDNLVGIDNNAVITIDENTAALLGKGESYGMDSGRINIQGSLDIASIFEVGRNGTAALIVDGGTVTQASGATFNGRLSGSTGYIEVKNGGSLDVAYFQSDGGSSTIVLTNETSSITTSGNNFFANNDAVQTDFQMYGGTFTTTALNYWGGATMNWLLAGGVCTNSGGSFVLQSRKNGVGAVSIIGGKLYTAGSIFIGNGFESYCQVVMSGGVLETDGYVYLGSGGSSVVDFEQSGGVINMKKTGTDFQVGNATGSTASYTLSGGTNNLVRNMFVPANGVDGSVI